MKHARHQRVNGRDGIALIIMIGMLAMILLLSVAFAAVMRTERLATRNYSDAVQARNIAHTGLSRVMQFIDEGMVNNQLLYPAPVYWSINSTTNVPALGFMQADDSEDWKWVIDKTRLSQKIVQMGSTWSTVTSGVEWLDIKDPSTNDQIGRYAFLAFDCSGMLDANKIAMINTRALGGDPGEIQISNAIPTDNTGTRNEFLNERSAYARFEAMSEIYKSSVTSANGAWTMFPFSYFPTNQLDRNGRPVTSALVGIDGINLPSHSQLEIENAFKACGATGPNESLYLYLAMQDFVDADNEPTSQIKGPSVEDIPMLNEVVLGVAQKVDATGTNTLLAIDHPYFEFVRPDLDHGDDEQYEITYSIAVQRIPQDPAPQSKGTFTVSFTSGRNYQVERSSTAAPIVVGMGAVPQTWTVYLQNVQVKNLDDNWIVDGISGDLVFKVPSSDVGPARFHDMECLDPRFNWDPAVGALHWEMKGIFGATNATSLGKINAWVKSYVPIDSNDADGHDIDISQVDERVHMYVKDAPFETVAELGYLPYAPWKTLRLYDYGTGHDGPHRVYDHFYVEQQSQKTRGYVNLLTDEPQALACAWLDMPVDNYPGGPVFYNVTNDQVVAVIGTEAVKNRKPNVPASTISDLAEPIGLLFDGSGVEGPADSEFQRESYFRNTERLLRVRQNIFTILVLAQSGAENPSGAFVSAAEAKAVAVVWRDPVLPDALGNRPTTEGMFVRSFKWLDD